MKILLLLIVIICTYILLLGISALFVDPDKEYVKNSPYFRWLLNSATAIMIFLLRIQVDVSGADNLPAGRFLLVSNHRSNFDPILTWYVFRNRDVAFISKKENFDIPIFGRIIRPCCFMAIDRKNPRNALLTINKASDLLRANEVSIGVYPEGTRSKECILLPFHSGVFKIAQKAHVPIVVMTISGTEKIHRNTPFRKTDVSIDILKVIPADQMAVKRSGMISDDVWKCMTDHFESGTGTD